VLATTEDAPAPSEGPVRSDTADAVAFTDSPHALGGSPRGSPSSRFFKRLGAKDGSGGAGRRSTGRSPHRPRTPTKADVTVPETLHRARRQLLADDDVDGGYPLRKRREHGGRGVPVIERVGRSPRGALANLDELADPGEVEAVRRVIPHREGRGKVRALPPSNGFLVASDHTDKLLPGTPPPRRGRRYRRVVAGIAWTPATRQTAPSARTPHGRPYQSRAFPGPCRRPQYCSVCGELSNHRQ